MKTLWLSICCGAPVKNGICDMCGKKVKGAYQGNYKRII